jgi:hypothetical protein
LAEGEILNSINVGRTQMAAEPGRGATAETGVSGKLPWKPMELTAVGTVVALLEGAGGSVGDPGGSGIAMMMVGL